LNVDAAHGLLLDECVDRLLTVPAFSPLRTIVFSRDIIPRAPDQEVLRLARTRHLILVTEDVGFGRLIIQKQIEAPDGVILIALDPMPRNERAAYLALRAPEALARAEGSFVTIGPRRTRSRKFPSVP
jgi:predicted nuclease of predicted toxin-antitoxin system